MKSNSRVSGNKMTAIKCTKVNGNKHKVMKYTRRIGGRRMNVALNDELLKEMAYFKYLQSKT